MGTIHSKSLGKSCIQWDNGHLDYSRLFSFPGLQPEPGLRSREPERSHAPGQILSRTPWWNGFQVSWFEKSRVHQLCGKVESGGGKGTLRLIDYFLVKKSLSIAELPPRHKFFGTDFSMLIEMSQDL